MRLSWNTLKLSQQNGTLGMFGTLNLELSDIGSRLSPVKPLGSYSLAINWHGTQADVLLKTVPGPMLLNGTGMIDNARLQFSGMAQSEAS